ncbi:hypothetical protein TeGR_g281 [Tetraparma gracilis]|uniref:Uncharacterized protein n=1 Tax=Tetraparma gracilis TaxID=2962635 RepID=A0ABQ6N8Q9_9STRA|nr:hypothetical protein TeGR_g281 [Tetraparma gracilis]
MPKTNFASLQAYLTSLIPLLALGDSGPKAAFVAAFVPLDCGTDDRNGFLADLSADDEEGRGAWRNLAAEIRHVEAGRAHTLEETGEEGSRQVVFHFEHPLLERCDREVVFVEVGGEWRAEG